MGISKHIAVLDLGTSYIRILVAKASDASSVKIIGKAEMKMEGIVSGNIKDENAVTESVAAAVEKIRSQTGLIIQSAYVSIPSDMISFVKNEVEMPFNEFKTVTDKDVGVILDKVTDVDVYDDEILIGVSPIQYSLDGEEILKNPSGLTGEELKVYANVVLGNREYVNTVKRCLSAAGVSVDGFIPLCLAMKWNVENACKADSILQIDVGDTLTEYAVYYKGIPYVLGSLPVGGANISSDISQIFGIGLEEADVIKKNYNAANTNVISKEQLVPLSVPANDGRDSIPVNEIAQVIKARVDNILECVGMNLYNEKIDLRYIENVIFTGDGLLNFQGVEDNCSEVLGIELDKIDFGRNVGMKNSFTYAGGMLLYIAEQLPLGRRSSKIVREEAPAPEEPKKKGIGGTIKEWVRNIMPGYRK